MHIARVLSIPLATLAVLIGGLVVAARATQPAEKQDETPSDDNLCDD